MKKFAKYLIRNPFLLFAIGVVSVILMSYYINAKGSTATEYRNNPIVILALAFFWVGLILTIKDIFKKLLGKK